MYTPKWATITPQPRVKRRISSTTGTQYNRWAVGFILYAAAKPATIPKEISILKKFTYNFSSMSMYFGIYILDTIPRNVFTILTEIITVLLKKFHTVNPMITTTGRYSPCDLNTTTVINTKIVVLVSGNELKLHNLIRMYPGVIFLSTDYYRRYQKKLTVRNMILTDWHQPASDIIDLL